MIVAAEPIDAEAFKSFGDVLAAPSAPGRLKFGDGLANLRAHAKPDLTMSLVAPQLAFPLAIRELERHRFSSQSFVPLSVSRWLVIVAPPRPDGGPGRSGAGRDLSCRHLASRAHGPRQCGAFCGADLARRQRRRRGVCAAGGARQRRASRYSPETVTARS
jgi:hypothetical protein